MMTFGKDQKFQIAIPISNISDFQSNNEEQQLGGRQITGNERIVTNYDDKKSKKNTKKQQSFFIEDLIKMVQISLIIALLVFVGIMCYAIFYEVREFWFSTQAPSVTDIVNLKISDPIIKMQLSQNEILKNEDKLQNIRQKSISQEIKQNGHQQKQLEVVSKQNTIKDVKLIAVETEKKKEQGEIIVVDNNNDDKRLQQRSNQKRQQTVLHLPVKQTISGNDDKMKNQQVSVQTQVYDPVLIQINKLRKKSGNRFKDSIYTMRNTSITEQQYQMARQLIEITRYYNPKQGNFDIQYSYTCSSPSYFKQSQCNQHKQSQIDSLIQREKTYYIQRYKPSWEQVQSQLPFCIIIPSYRNNHGDNIFRNLNSIFQQQYSNYHVIYIDDHSTDGTKQKVQQYMTNYGIKQQLLQLHVNQVNQKALSNIYMAVHSYCHSKEIMIIVDGDDYLIGTQVLKLLNYQYQNKKLLAAYTNYLRINQPYYVKVGTSTPYPKAIVDKREFRKNYNIFRASHLRSFYVDLFRRIKPQDLQDENHHFFTAANDFAIMMPILQMSSPHVQYIPELTYLYDSGTGLNNFQSKKGVQTANAKIISRRKMYPSVDINEFYGVKDQSGK